MTPSEIFLFVQFGLTLNVISFLLHLVASSISASRLGMMRSFEISQISLNIFAQYKELMLKHHKFAFYAEQFSLFIPFYATWQYFILLINPRNCSYFERIIVLKDEKVTDLINEYGKD